MAPKNLFARLQWRKRYREQTYRHGERGGEGEMYGESNMETYITISLQPPRDKDPQERKTGK